MNPHLKDLVSLLDLEKLEENLYRGQSRHLDGKSVFGGQVVSQALMAATRTVETPRCESTALGGAESRAKDGAAGASSATRGGAMDGGSDALRAMPHSLHAYFLRPGDMTQAIVYDVDRVRDGRSFIARRVQAIQNGQPILSMIASFQKPEPGLEHQAPMPAVPPPEQQPDIYGLRKAWLDQHPEIDEAYRSRMLRAPAIEFRAITPANPMEVGQRAPLQRFWFRAAGQLPDDPLLHQALLAYASDFNLLSTALLPHTKGWFSNEMICASIDHALWFHRPVRVDDWLLYDMDAPTAQAARGFSRGLIYDRAGRLVASVAQESLMRDTSLT